jgi:hypothetical protein
MGFPTHPHIRELREGNENISGEKSNVIYGIHNGLAWRGAVYI